MRSSSLLLFGLLVVSQMQPQDTPPTGGPPGPALIVTRTRTVAIFYELEQQLLDARLKHEKAALTKLTADDFEVRRSSAPSSPIPREEWLQDEGPGFPASEFHLSDMAVHLNHESAAVVSFIYRAGTGRIFVVDVWNKAGDAWKLSVRYSAPAGPAAAVADHKPDGKQ